MNKANLPKEAIFSNTGRNKKPRGTMKCMKAEKDGKNYYFTSWMDTKAVHMLHTYPTYYQTISRGVRDPITGAYSTVNITQPTVISDYNKGMGGTDLQDQRASYYRFQHRTTKWPHRLISSFITTSSYNAYVLLKKRNHLQFLYLLVRQLAGIFDDDDDDDDNDDENEDDGEDEDDSNYDTDYAENDDDSDDDESVAPKRKDKQEVDLQPRKRSKGWLKALTRLDGNHTPSISHLADDRGMCVCGCGNKSQAKCLECNAFLCISGKNYHNCWWKFHNLENFRE